MSDRTEMTAEGQVYRDAMMKTEVEVTKIDDDAVYVRDVALVGDESMQGAGSPYPWEMWDNAKEVGRFTLESDVDREEAAERSDKEEVGSTEPDEEESAEEESEPTEKEVTPEDFEAQDALSW